MRSLFSALREASYGTSPAWGNSVGMGSPGGRISGPQMSWSSYVDLHKPQPAMPQQGFQPFYGQNQGQAEQPFYGNMQPFYGQEQSSGYQPFYGADQGQAEQPFYGTMEPFYR